MYMCLHWKNRDLEMKLLIILFVALTMAAFDEDGDFGFEENKYDAINWHNHDWAFGCDWLGNNLFSMKMEAPECRKKCLNIGACTHFTWNLYDGGTCWLKQGKVEKGHAFESSDISAICGICGFVLKDNLMIDDELPPKGKLIWSTKFNTTTDIEEDWIQEKGGDGWGNHEYQYYTDNNKNIKVVDQNLEIETRKENFVSNRYTSARLSSRKSFKYGVFEMRAKLPSGRGIWPAFWMLSTTRPMYWPEDGEIDIMEYVGYKPNEIFGTVHFGTINQLINKQRGQTISIADEKNWNLYQLDWSENAIKIYVNDKKYFQYNNDKRNDNSTWPFNHEFNILLNTAVGGKFGGEKGIDDSIFPQTYTIDYVRQFERKV